MRFFFAFSRFANHPPGPGPTSGRLLSAAKVEQNNPNEECDLIQWHTGFSIVLERESALGLAFDEIAA